jgi:hypothetical protein
MELEFGAVAKRLEAQYLKLFKFEQLPLLVLGPACNESAAFGLGNARNSSRTGGSRRNSLG